MKTFFIPAHASVSLFLGILLFRPATSDIQEGLIVDKVFRSLQPLDRPGYMQTVKDPAFGVTIRRITDAGAGNVIKPAYSTIPAWNMSTNLSWRASYP